MEDKRKRIEVCYTPGEYDYFKDEFEIVVVIDVLPNRVLVIEGARMVTFSGESYYAVLKGMVREEDIGFGFKDGLRYRNIISSQYIADAQIEFVSKGSLNDAQKESWYQRLASILNPF